MSQRSFASAEYAMKKKQTRRGVAANVPLRIASAFLVRAAH